MSRTLARAAFSALLGLVAAGCRYPSRCFTSHCPMSVNRSCEPSLAFRTEDFKPPVAEPPPEEDAFGPEGPIPIVGSGEGWTTELQEAACKILDDSEIPYTGSADLGLVWIGVRQSDRQRAYQLLSSDKRLIPFLVPPDKLPEQD